MRIASSEGNCRMTSFDCLSTILTTCTGSFINRKTDVGRAMETKFSRCLTASCTDN